MAAASRLRTLLVLAGALLAVAVAMVTGGRLQAGAIADRDAEQKLTTLRLELAHVQDVPWSASPEEGDDPQAVRDELFGARTRIERSLARLRVDRDVDAIEAPVARGLDALSGQLALVASGRTDEASELSGEAARHLAAADAGLRAAARRYRADSSHALLRARAQWSSLILVLFAAFAWSYVRVARARDIAERLSDEKRRLLEVTRREALTDALTGLGNRRALMAALDAASPDLAVAVFDLNGFKQYNDRFGHPAGDALLARLGERLATTVEGVATAYRMGGDEFCVLTAGAVDALAPAAAAALSEAGDGFEIDCAYGIARIPDDTLEPDTALRLADQRMYQDKAAHRTADPGFVADTSVPVLARGPARYVN